MAPARPVTIRSPTGIAVRVTDRGRYEIVDRNLGWTFAGTVGARVGTITSGRSRDRAGGYREIAFAFEGPNGAARHAAIRLYDRRRVVLFELTFLDAGTTAEMFPSLSGYPRSLHHLAYTGVFGRFSFTRFGNDGPWAFFDDDANTFLLSAAAHFMNASLSRGPRGQLRSGIVATPNRIQAGFVHTSVLALAPGINRAFEIWGQFLTDLAGKKRPANDADAGLKYLGYWTDHGARYYYRRAPGLDYAATLLKVRDEFRDAGIRLGNMQLDSWFYRKGRKGRWRSTDHFGGGTYLYEAAPEVFPEGLGAFQEKLGLPLITHNRWIDAHSPDRKKYAISGNVATDPALWRKWMGDLRAAGVRTYEQDWLSKMALPERTLDAGEKFMDSMAAAAKREGITLQYCMALPRHFLQGTHYDNLTTIRTSGDRLKERDWKPFLFNGRLASALGEWPWTDVFNSTQTTNILLATLSGAMVGVGDAIGKLDRDNLLRAARPDGIIVKPDETVTPLDRSYVAQAKDRDAPVVAVARTNHDGWITSYIFAIGGRRASVTPAALGYAEPVYAYNFFGQTGRYLKRDELLRFAIPAHDAAYWIVVPVGASRIGFVGDADKFVANGKNRIARLADNGALTARIVLAKGEDRVRLQGFSPALPYFTSRGGTIANLTYDSRSGLFRFDLIARAGALPEITGRLK